MRFSCARFFTKFAVFIMVWSAFFGSSAANAAEVQYIRDTLTRVQKSENANHTITFYFPTGLSATSPHTTTIKFSTTTAGQTNFTFPTGGTTTRDIDIATTTVDTSAGAFACSDATQGGGRTYGTSTMVTSTIGRTGAWGFNTSTVSGGHQVLIETPTDKTPVDMGLNSAFCMRVRIGSNTSGSSPQAFMTNPSWTSTASNQFLIAISNADDSGQGAIAIVEDDQITSTATSTPSMTFNVGTMATATACNDTTADSSFGTTALTFYDLRADFVEPTSNKICSRVTTNAANGAIVQMRSQFGGMTTTRGGVYFPATDQTDGSTTVGTNVVPGTNTLNTSTERYGACVQDSGFGAATPTSQDPKVKTGYGISATSSASCATSQNTAFSSNAVFYQLPVNSFDTVWSTTGATYRAYAAIYLNAAVTVNTPVSNAYYDTLTLIAYATF